MITLLKYFFYYSVRVFITFADLKYSYTRESLRVDDLLWKIKSQLCGLGVPAYEGVDSLFRARG